MGVKLREYQIQAIKDLKNGSILCGGVGSGKSRTAIAYYLIEVCKGEVAILEEVDEKDVNLPFWCESYKEMENPKDLYIITTAKKRDSLEWEKECAAFGLCGDPSSSHSGVKVTIDSWNNIKKYKDVYDAFFIFDEQRVIGSGAWVKAFLNITRKNKWILLSATPGDQWSDYIPVFVANGFYKNKTDFTSKHCVYSRFSKYPKIERYVGEEELKQHRKEILVYMYDNRKTERVRLDVFVEYDKDLLKQVYVARWNPYENCPIEESGKWVYLMRKVINSDPSRIQKVYEIWKERERAIVFYNYNYELDLLRELCEGKGIAYGEWNGQKHEDLPNGKQWLYLVQYSAGSEGWNCISTNTTIFYSQTYSYRQIEQASGRIDRINTPYHKLYYYHLRSRSWLDALIYQKLKNKQNFNESCIRFERR